MKKQALYVALSHALLWTPKADFADERDRRIKECMGRINGGGIDVEIDSISDDKMVFKGHYHLMNPDGYYDGYFPFAVTVTASLRFGFLVNAKGPFSKLKSCYYGLDDFLVDTFNATLLMEIEGE